MADDPNAPPEYDLHELLLRAAQGDRLAWEAIEVACHDTVASYVRHKIPNGQLAGAITAEVFQTAWRAVGTYEATYVGASASGRAQSVQHWLLQLARDCVVRHYERPDEPA